MDVHTPPRPSLLVRIGTGLKAGFALILFSPFLVFLLPMWFIHRLVERRAGRPDPPLPWVAARLTWSDTVGARATLKRDMPDSGEEEADAPAAIIAPAVRGTALVTGGARRLGAHICRELASMGYGVAVVHNQSRLQAEGLCNDIRQAGGVAHPFSADLANPGHTLALLDMVSEKMGPVTLLINNAALFTPTPDCCGEWEEMERLMRVNLQAPLWLSLEAASHMSEQRGGQIINMGDIWGERPLRGHSAYCASKAGLLMITKVLARDFAPKVRVNAIAPGGVLAPDKENADQGFARITAKTPLAEMADPREVTRALRYLLDARFVTGEILFVDGGRRLV